MLCSVGIMHLLLIIKNISISADVYAQQEKLVLGTFCDCLIKLMCRGKAKGKECTSFKTLCELIHCRDKLTTEIWICGEKALQVHNGLCE